MTFKPWILAALAAGAAPLAFAAGPVFLTHDHSSGQLIDKAAAQAVWTEQIEKAGPKRLNKLFPASKWGFVSQVEGGFNSAKICVVTARVALVPRSGKELLFKPEEMATAFDAQPGATQEQCKALAKDKLVESISAVMSSVMKPR